MLNVSTGIHIIGYVLDLRVSERSASLGAILKVMTEQF